MRYPIESCITLARIARQADMSKPSNGNGRDRTGTIETLKVAKDDNNNNTNQDFFNQGVWPEPLVFVVPYFFINTSQQSGNVLLSPIRSPYITT